ncbi:MAG: hypothetical protein N3D20_01875 [Candidatus Pacearchaeota archaeon]|nr:hypothetical protein [Candidatus Pacearchaeota archaeon]
MKKFESKEEAEKRRKRNVKIMSGLMLLVMVVSTFAFGYTIFMENEKENIGNTKIEQVGDEWFVKYGDNYLRFRNSPYEFNNNSFEVDMSLNFDIEDYYGKVVYVSSKNKAALYEIGQNLGKYTERMQEVCYGSCEENLPEKNCSELLIVFNESENRKIFQKENCVFIEGDLKTLDLFLWKTFKLE